MSKQTFGVGKNRKINKQGGRLFRTRVSFFNIVRQKCTNYKKICTITQYKNKSFSMI